MIPPAAGRGGQAIGRDALASAPSRRSSSSAASGLLTDFHEVVERNLAGALLVVVGQDLADVLLLNGKPQRTQRHLRRDDDASGESNRRSVARCKRGMRRESAAMVVWLHQRCCRRPGRHAAHLQLVVIQLAGLLRVEELKRLADLLFLVLRQLWPRALQPKMVCMAQANAIEWPCCSSAVLAGRRHRRARLTFLRIRVVEIALRVAAPRGAAAPADDEAEVADISRLIARTAPRTFIANVRARSSDGLAQMRVL